MVKYCYKCGAEMDEKDSFCPECGTAVVELSGKKQEGTTNVKNPKTIRNIIIVAAVVVFILALTFVVKDRGTSFDHCEKMLKKVTAELKKGDADALMDLASEHGCAYIMATKDISKSEVENYYQNWIEQAFNTYENEVGDIEDISFEIDEITDCLETTGMTPEEWIEANNAEGITEIYNAKKLKAVYIVRWRIKVKGSDGVYEADINPSTGVGITYVIKEGSKWTMTYYPNGLY